jgi:dCMP deaminase
VLVQGKKLLGTAYNGAPMGVADCSEAGCMIVEEIEVQRDGEEERMVKKQRCIRTIHAEQNLLLFTDRIDREGSTVYVTDQPCWSCANMLANSGIKEIVYHRSYPKDSDKVVGLMRQKGIAFRTLAGYEPPAQAGMNVIS